jgi:4-hydroxythreonine-4-phosphate dehydrogenase
MYGIASGTSLGNSSRFGGTSTDCAGRPTSTSGRKHTKQRPRIAVTLGDPRGIGPEITAAALDQPVGAELTLVGAQDQIAGLPADHRIAVGSWGLGSGDDGRDRSRAIRAGRIAGHAVEQAVRLALDGKVDAIVTAPAHKHALYLAGFPYPGHTEWLAHLAGDVDVAMMLAAEATGQPELPSLRVVLVTTHVPLRDVPALLTTDRIVRAGRVAQRGLREWYGIEQPRIAVCALNPHGGESGLFGDEEERVLTPAASALGAAGPLPADTVFVRAMRGEFDAVLAPYHDVGMTAIKVAAFGRAVNVTLGLPFPRTSPDHGTAFDIAGTGQADPSSMRAALDLATRLARRAARD